MSGRKFREMEENRASKNRSPSWRDRRSNHLNRYENHQKKNRRNYDVNDKYDNGYNHNFKSRNYATPRRYFNNDCSRNPQLRDNHFQSSRENRSFRRSRSNSFSRSRSRERNCRRHYSSHRDSQNRYKNNYNPKRNKFNGNRQQNQQKFNNRRYQNKRKRSDESGYEDNKQNLNTVQNHKRKKIYDERNHDEDHIIKRTNTIGELESSGESENNCDRSINEETFRTDDHYLEEEKLHQQQEDKTNECCGEINYDEEYDQTIKRSMDELYSDILTDIDLDKITGSKSSEDINAPNEADLENNLLSDEEYDPLNSGYLNDMLCDEKTNLDMAESRENLITDG